MSLPHHDEFSAADAIQRGVTFFVYALLWSFLFLTIRLGIFRKEKAELSNRVVSILHCLTAFFYCATHVNLSEFYSDYGGRNKPWQATLLTISGSNFFYDTFSTMYSDIEATGRVDPFMFIHHVVTLLGIFVGVFQDKSGPELTACLLITEISGPCMHIRQLLKGTVLGQTGFAQMNEYTFVFVFLVARCFLGPKIVYYTVVSPRTPLVVKIGGVGLLLVSFAWAFFMMKVLARKLFGIGKAAEKQRKKKAGGGEQGPGRDEVVRASGRRDGEGLGLTRRGSRKQEEIYNDDGEDSTLSEDDDGQGFLPGTSEASTDLDTGSEFSDGDEGEFYLNNAASAPAPVPQFKKEEARKKSGNGQAKGAATGAKHKKK